MRRNGFIETATFIALFWSFVGVNIIISQLPSVKDNFRERKAIEQCEANQNPIEVDCNSAVAGMSKEEILAYIKDDSQTGNRGYVN